jgi:cephalosporin hydroxylase
MPMNKPMINPVMAFEQEKRDSIATYRDEGHWRELSNTWMNYAFKKRYMYNFSSLGRPIIQTPVDMVAMQELIWAVKPDLVIETGIAHGGSLILSASMLALLDYCEAVEQGTMLDPSKPKRRVIGIDIDIRAHNRAEMEKHPLTNRIDMVLGSSTAPETVAQVRTMATSFNRILVCLDSNHTHEHVLAELEAYAPMTSKGSYCVVFDTIVEDLPDGTFPDRPWKKGNNPKTAVWEYLKLLKSKGRKADDGDALNFEIDRMMEDKLVLSVAPDGYLRRV